MTSGPGDAQQDAWRQHRSEAAAEHQAAQGRREQAETEQAAALVADFVAQARALGLPETTLAARARTGGARYRTGVRGWYLKRNHALGVDGAGRFYILNVAPSWRARVLGASLTPSDPPLVVGRGGRDGESMPLADLLRLRLAAGTSWD